MVENGPGPSGPCQAGNSGLAHLPGRRGRTGPASLGGHNLDFSARWWTWKFESSRRGLPTSWVPLRFYSKHWLSAGCAAGRARGVGRVDKGCPEQQEGRAVQAEGAGPGERGVHGCWPRGRAWAALCQQPIARPSLQAPLPAPAPAPATAGPGVYTTQRADSVGPRPAALRTTRELQEKKKERKKKEKAPTPEDVSGNPYVGPWHGVFLAPPRF